MPTQTQIAEHLDLSQAEVSKLMASLEIDWTESDLATIRVLYIRKLRAVAAGHKSNDGADLTAERVLTERIDREIKQLDLAERKGQLVSLVQLEPELRQMVAAFRTEVQGLPDKIKDELDALHGIDIDIGLLEEHVYATFAQLARYDPERAGTRAPTRRAARAAAEDVDVELGEDAPAHVSENDGEAWALQPGPDAVGSGNS